MKQRCSNSCKEKVYTHTAGIPTVYLFAEENDYFALVLELLGPNLEDMLCYCMRRITIKTVLSVADQLVFTYLR